MRGAESNALSSDFPFSHLLLSDALFPCTACRCFFLSLSVALTGMHFGALHISCLIVGRRQRIKTTIFHFQLLFYFAYFLANELRSAPYPEPVIHCCTLNGAVCFFRVLQFSIWLFIWSWWYLLLNHFVFYLLDCFVAIYSCFLPPSSPSGEIKQHQTSCSWNLKNSSRIR